MSDAAALARELHALEIAAQRWALAQYLRLRRDLVGALDARGIAGLRRVTVPLFEAFEERLHGDLSQLAAQVESAVVDGTRAEFSRLGVDASIALVFSASARQAVATTLSNAAAPWAGIVRDRLLVEALGVSAGVDAGLVRGRLLGRNLDDGHSSIWRSGVPMLYRDIWELIWKLANMLRSLIIGQAPQLGGHNWRREAIATIDAKTTDCCRQIDGAVVGLFEPFHLTGTPRFADYMLEPPFHWFCRTVVALRLGEG